MVADVRSNFSLNQYAPLIRQPGFSPVLLAGVFAIGYFVFCSLYIWFSGSIAAHLSGSVADLQKIETIKGIIFIAVTTILIFAIIWFFLARIHSDEIRLIQQQDELIKSRQESLAGIFASSVAHDINNNIMVLNYYCDVFAGSGLDTPAFKDARAEAKSVLNELKELANRLMQVGRGNLPGEFSKINIAQLAKNTVRFMRKHDALYPSVLEYSGPDSMEITGNESALRQILINLILNAAQAINGRGEIRVLIDRMEQNIIIEVHDNGPGVEPYMREKIFEAFTTTKSRGFGLGLTSVKVYTGMHNGTVEVNESHLGGACFRIMLPANGPDGTLN